MVADHCQRCCFHYAAVVARQKMDYTGVVDPSHGGDGAAAVVVVVVLYVVHQRLKKNGGSVVGDVYWLGIVHSSLPIVHLSYWVKRVLEVIACYGLAALPMMILVAGAVAAVVGASMIPCVDDCVTAVFQTIDPVVDLSAWEMKSFVLHYFSAAMVIEDGLVVPLVCLLHGDEDDVLPLVVYAEQMQKMKYGVKMVVVVNAHPPLWNHDDMRRRKQLLHAAYY